jgi:thiol-disulfide isomerase/thioredoxin
LQHTNIEIGKEIVWQTYVIALQTSANLWQVSPKCENCDNILQFIQKVASFTQIAFIYANAHQTSRSVIIFSFFSIKTFCMGSEMMAKSVRMIRFSLAMMLASASKTLDFARASLVVASFSFYHLSSLSAMVSSFLTINSLKVSWNANEEA